MSDDLPSDEELAGSISSEKKESEKKKPILPDGIGLRLDDVCALINKEHKTHVPKDDPILMAITIHNAFLKEHVRLFERHEKALAVFMNGQTKAFAEKVQDELKPLSKMLSTLTIEGIQSAVAGFTKSLSSFQTTMFFCTAIQAVAAILIVIALFFGGHHG